MGVMRVSRLWARPLAGSVLLAGIQRFVLAGCQRSGTSRQVIRPTSRSAYS
jgi:hypothetical protein